MSGATKDEVFDRQSKAALIPRRYSMDLSVYTAVHHTSATLRLTVVQALP